MNIKDFTLTPSVRSEPVAREDDELNRLIAILRSRARLLVSVVILVLAGVLIVTSQTPRRYTADATVMIDSRKRDVSDIQQVMADLPANSDAVDTEVEILKSRTLAGPRRRRPASGPGPGVQRRAEATQRFQPGSSERSGEISASRVSSADAHPSLRAPISSP